MAKQIEDNVIQLDAKIDEIKTDAIDTKEILNQGLANVADDLGRKILESANQIDSRCDEKLEKNSDILKKQIDENIEKKLGDVKITMDELEKNVADALETEKNDREKLAEDTKMAFEEEKMLRAQDIGIIRSLEYFFRHPCIFFGLKLVYHTLFSFLSSFDKIFDSWAPEFNAIVTLK